MKSGTVIFWFASFFCLTVAGAFEATVGEYRQMSVEDLKTAFRADREAVRRVYDAANRAFENKNYGEAVDLYQLLVTGEQASDSLYLNLGTAHFRNGSPGVAALWFRRATHVKPGIPEVRQNFEFLRRQQGLLEFGAAEWQRFLLRLSPGLLSWAAWIPLWMTLFSLLFVIFGSRLTIKPLLIAAAFFAATGSAAFFGLGWYRAKHLAPENFATVVEKGTSALTAPAPDSDPVVSLPEGSEIRVIQDTGPWIYASIPGDVVGWVHHSSIERNWPIPTERTNFMPLDTDL